MKKITNKEFKNETNNLLSFIEKSPTAFHAVNEIKAILKNEGFSELKEDEKFKVKANGKYFITRNDSSIIALNLGNMKNPGLRIAASHSDSPAFKVKEEATLEVRGKYTKLNTEGYGGMLLHPWLDRPLSLAGRVILKTKTGFKSQLVNIKKDLVLIPNVAIHLIRDKAREQDLNKQIDMLPLFAGSPIDTKGYLGIIAKELKIKPEDIYGTDIFLYNRTPASIWGVNEEFVSAPRLDDLQCAYSSLMGFLKASKTTATGSENAVSDNVSVYACFDNEEVGSTTKQGAASTFLKDVLARVFSALNKTEEDLKIALAKGFMLSCDNGHAVHPNHPEKTDDKNCVYMNEGVVIKQNANQKYTSDALSIAMFKDICEKAGVPYQFYSNRSDILGGSTLGNISQTQLALNTVDIGLAQLSMHSPYETAGVKDTAYMIAAITEFYKVVK